MTIKETGLYKTRDGHKAFVSDICCREVTGVVEGIQGIITWDIDGKCVDCYDLPGDFDLVLKLEVKEK